jgi:hypothetical protein
VEVNEITTFRRTMCGRFRLSGIWRLLLSALSHFPALGPRTGIQSIVSTMSRLWFHVVADEGVVGGEVVRGLGFSVVFFR